MPVFIGFPVGQIYVTVNSSPKFSGFAFQLSDMYIALMRQLKVVPANGGIRQLQVVCGNAAKLASLC